MNYQKILEKYISPIGSICMLLATIILLILTIKYLKFTKNMAVMMKEEFEIRLTPTVDEILKTCTLSSLLELEPHFIIINKGSYVINIVSYEIKSWHEDFKDKPIFPFKKEFNKPIAPNESIEIRDRVSLARLKKLNLKGKERHRIFSEITFKFLDTRGKKFIKKYEFNTILDKIN